GRTLAAQLVEVLVRLEQRLLHHVRRVELPLEVRGQLHAGEQAQVVPVALQPGAVVGRGLWHRVLLFSFRHRGRRGEPPAGALFPIPTTIPPARGGRKRAGPCVRRGRRQEWGRTRDGGAGGRGPNPRRPCTTASSG